MYAQRIDGKQTSIWEGEIQRSNKRDDEARSKYYEYIIWWTIFDCCRHTHLCARVCVPPMNFVPSTISFSIIFHTILHTRRFWCHRLGQSKPIRSRSIRFIECRFKSKPHCQWQWKQANTIPHTQLWYSSTLYQYS